MNVACPLIGRTEELRRLAELARHADQGQCQVVFISGPAGIGKTTLMEACAASLENFRFVRVRGSAGQRLIEFDAVNRLLQALSGEGNGPVKQISRDSTVLAAGGALIAAADDFKGPSPLGLLIEDAHQIDTASLQALGFMLLRTSRDRVLAVMGTEHVYLTRRETGFARDRPGVVQLDVEGLTLAETRDFMSAMGSGPVSPSRLAVVHRWSAGNPLYLRALVRSDASGGPTAENPAHGAIPPALSHIVRDWAKSFLPGGTRVLGALAVLGTPADLPTLQHMTGSSALLDDIEPLIREGAAKWVTPGDGSDRLALIHQGQRDALYLGIPLSRRKELHRQAAALLDPPERWQHQIAAADAYDGDLAGQLRAAVPAELHHGDPAQAARWLLGISEVDPVATARNGALLEAVRLLATSGHYQAALAHSARVHAAPAGAGRSEALGLLELAHGHDAGAAEHLLKAWHGYGDDEEGAARAAIELSGVQATLGLGWQAVQAAQFAVAHSSDPQVIGQAQSVIVFAEALLKGPAAALTQLSHLRDNPTAVSVHDLGSLACRGILRSLTGQFHPALDDLTVIARRRSPHLAQRGGFGALIHIAACLVFLGEWTEARRSLSLALDEAQTVGRELDFAMLHSFSAALAAFQGRWSDAEEDLFEARALAAASDFSGPYYHYVQGAAAVAFARQDWQGVIDPLARLVKEPSHRDRARVYRLWSFPFLGVAYSRIHDADAADEMAAALEELAPCGAAAAVSAAWVRGNASAARQDLAGALRHLRDGLAVRSDGGEPALHRALLRCDYGRLLIESGQKAEAETQLTQAAEALRAMGAVPLEVWCAGLLAQTDSLAGLTAAQGFWAALTDRERDVAKLVGHGWTNKEIAQELYVTTKTVEFHLQNIYGKGEGRNRRQVRDLVQMLAASGT
ncbi:AAA family ATPase [Streptomyces sp. NPDC093223]|uniref:helix-turn-helix transcriptional regulator n=1 Tax=Streptomyces sp. NPDC093223 TaxID=3366033 RepID=UPI00382F226B